jgi:hypothetical protein
VIGAAVYQWYEFKSRRGKNKNCTAQQSNSNTVWFNFQAYIYIYIDWFDFIMLNATFSNISAISWRVYIYIYIYIYICVCVCVCLYVCLWHVSIRIFNLFMTPLRKIRLRAFVTDNNQLAWKCNKKTCYTSSALTWLAGLLTMHCMSN